MFICRFEERAKDAENNWWLILKSCCLRNTNIMQIFFCVKKKWRQMKYNKNNNNNKKIYKWWFNYWKETDKLSRFLEFLFVKFCLWNKFEVLLFKYHILFILYREYLAFLYTKMICRRIYIYDVGEKIYYWNETTKYNK